jgi:hypothetical protein
LWKRRPLCRPSRELGRANRRGKVFAGRITEPRHEQRLDKQKHDTSDSSDGARTFFPYDGERQEVDGKEEGGRSKDDLIDGVRVLLKRKRK